MKEGFKFESVPAPTMKQRLSGLVDTLDEKNEGLLSFNHNETTFYIQSNTVKLPEKAVLVTHYDHHDGRDFLVFSMADDERVGN